MVFVLGPKLLATKNREAASGVGLAAPMGGVGGSMTVPPPELPPVFPLEAGASVVSPLPPEHATRPLNKNMHAIDEIFFGTLVIYKTTTL